MMTRYLSDENNDIGFRLYFPEEEKAEFSEFSCAFETFGFEDDIEGRSLGIDASDRRHRGQLRC